MSQDTPLYLTIWLRGCPPIEILVTPDELELFVNAWRYIQREPEAAKEHTISRSAHYKAELTILLHEVIAFSTSYLNTSNS